MKTGELDMLVLCVFGISDRVRFSMNMSCQLPSAIPSSLDLPQEVCEGFNDEMTKAVNNF